MPNFSQGPHSVIGREDTDVSRFEATLPNTGSNYYSPEEFIEPLERSGLASPEAIDALRSVVANWRENNPGDVMIFFTPGRAEETPATSGGRGSYNYWKDVGGAYIDTKVHDSAHWGENGEVVDTSDLWIQFVLAAKE
jgi:hypothetical protein